MWEQKPYPIWFSFLRKTYPVQCEQSLKAGKLRFDSVAAHAYSSHHGSLEFLIALSVRAVKTVGQASAVAFWYASNDYTLSQIKRDDRVWAQIDNVSIYREA